MARAQYNGERLAFPLAPEIEWPVVPAGPGAVCVWQDVLGTAAGRSAELTETQLGRT